VSWYRITLDEAHFIKDRACSTAQAVFKLTSRYKWCAHSAAEHISGCPARPEGAE
jgi:SNF2 family DNA or RNA helicase